jgi:hypothetical protein
MENEPDQYATQITGAAIEFLRGLEAALPETFEGHIETEIAGVASVAGAVLLRDTYPQVEEMPWGAVITGTLVDQLYVAQHRMQALFVALAPRWVSIPTADGMRKSRPSTLRS